MPQLPKSGWRRKLALLRMGVEGRANYKRDRERAAFYRESEKARADKGIKNIPKPSPEPEQTSKGARRTGFSSRGRDPAELREEIQIGLPKTSSRSVSPQIPSSPQSSKQLLTEKPPAQTTSFQKKASRKKTARKKAARKVAKGLGFTRRFIDAGRAAAKARKSGKKITPSKKTSKKVTKRDRTRAVRIQELKNRLGDLREEITKIENQARSEKNRDKRIEIRRSLRAMGEEFKTLRDELRAEQNRKAA